MRLDRWQLRLAGALGALTLVWYVLRWYLFPGVQMHDEMLRFLVGDIAFLFLQVLVVTLFIDSAMQKRRTDELKRKLNMIVGAFFSEMGTSLLGRIAATDTRLASVRGDLCPRPEWTAAEFSAAGEAFRAHRPQIQLSGHDLVGLRDLLAEERPHLLSLLGNQSLLEHETFTDLLWAITHLAEELAARSDLTRLGNADQAHIEADVNRAYTLLGAQWIVYLGHLKSDYPYLFALAVRTNPLDPSARAEVV